MGHGCFALWDGNDTQYPSEVDFWSMVFSPIAIPHAGPASVTTIGDSSLKSVSRRMGDQEHHRCGYAGRPVA